MDLKDLKLKTVMYYMQSFVITAGNTTFEVPRTMILNIDIDKQFDLMIYPMWYVSVNVPLWFYTEITKNTDNLSVSMNLQYQMTDTNYGMYKDSVALTSEVIGNFKAIAPYTTQIADSTLQTEVQKRNNTYKKNYLYNEYAIVELALYNAAAYNASFNRLNAVLSNTTVTNAITYCFNRCGITNILLSKSDNSKSYSEFKILPDTGIQNILRIVDDYKFHEGGSTVFFDLVDSYLITNKIGCYVWKNNEYKATHFISSSEYSEGLGNFDGVYINNKEKYNIISVEKESFTSTKLNSAPLFNTTNETEFVQIVTKQATMSLLTPNKEFIVNIDTANAKKYNGKYRIRSMSLKLVPNGELLDPTFTITLRR